MPGTIELDADEHLHMNGLEHPPVSDLYAATKKYVDDIAAAQNELSELDDVNLSGLADRDLLQYDNGTSKWVNRAISDAINFDDIAGDLDLADLADYARGSLIVGTAADWAALAKGTAGQILMSDGTDLGWTTTFTADMLFTGTTKTTFDDGGSYINAGAPDYLDLHWPDDDTGERHYSGANLLMTLRRVSNALPTATEIEFPVLASFIVNGTLVCYFSDLDFNITKGLAVTGDIIVSGTVDGVDVAAFKAAYDVHGHPLTDLGSYARGSLIVGGAADWEDLAKGTAGQILMSDGTDLGWTTTFTAHMLFASSTKAYFDAGAAAGGEFIYSDADGSMRYEAGAGDLGHNFYVGSNLLLTVTRYSAGVPQVLRLNTPTDSVYYFDIADTTRMSLSKTAAIFQTRIELQNDRYIHLNGDWTSGAIYTIIFGGGIDALIGYNNTNLIIHPANVGSGKVYIGPTANEDICAANYFLGVSAAEYAHTADAGHYDIEAATSIDLNAPVFFAGYIEGVEIADPGAPAADKGRLFFKESAPASGKTGLFVQFPTGGNLLVAVEP